MKKLVIFLLLGTSSIATAEVSTRICPADGNTPLELADPNVPFVYRDIMVGTRVAIIVSADAGGFWDGGLYITGTDRDYGVLSARDYNDATLDWEGSRFEAAGDRALVSYVEDFARTGFDLHAHNTAMAGDWFIIDYTATNVGTCNMGFYDYSVDWDYPAYEIVFSHVPTRDFDGDTKVGFADFATFALYWGTTSCSEPGWCEGTDLDADGDVDNDDLALFADYWLERTQ